MEKCVIFAFCDQHCEKTFECDFCSKCEFYYVFAKDCDDSYTQSHNLKLHIQKVHGTAVFKSYLQECLLINILNVKIVTKLTHTFTLFELLSTLS